MHDQNYRKLLELLPDMRGITIKSFKINSNAPPIYYLAVDFEVRQSWFTDSEIRFFIINGFISSIGDAMINDKTNFNSACAGMNDILQNTSDYEHWRYYLHIWAGSRSRNKTEVIGSQR